MSGISVIDIAGFFKRHPVLTALVVLIGVPYLYIQWQYPTYTLRYRLTVEVETPQGLKTGSSVIKTIREEHIQFLPEVGVVTWRVTGEAVFVDLGGGKNLVVTLTSNASGRSTSAGAAGLPFSQGPDLNTRGYPAKWREVVRLGIRNIPPARLPTTVTFTDISDPKSVKLVDPRDLAATFGEGYGIKRATVEVTRDGVTEGIEGKLGWLGSLTVEKVLAPGKRILQYRSLRGVVLSELKRK